MSILYARTHARLVLTPREARIDDEAQVLAPADVPRFETYLRQIFVENGADIRMTFVREVPNGDLESFSLGRARAVWGCARRCS